MSRGKSMANKVNDKLIDCRFALLKSLASNPEVYKGSAEDAAKLPKLTEQLLCEFLDYINSLNLTDEANSNGL